MRLIDLKDHIASISADESIRTSDLLAVRPETHTLDPPGRAVAHEDVVYAIRVVADRTRGLCLKQHVAATRADHSRPRASLEVGSVVELPAGRVNALTRGPI